VTSPQTTTSSGSAPTAPTEDTGKPATPEGRLGWREAVSIVIELAGIGVLGAGFWLIRPWAGLIVLGAVGFDASPRFDRRKHSP
jgi:hypothetical protein